MSASLQYFVIGALRPQFALGVRFPMWCNWFASVPILLFDSNNRQILPCAMDERTRSQNTNTAARKVASCELSPDGTLIAVAAVEKSELGITRWKVAIFPIRSDVE